MHVFEDLPIVTQAAAMRLLRESRPYPMRCGYSLVAGGYWVESHTLGCREEGGDEDLWAAHWEFWDKYSKDGVSILIGDPTEGVFVSISPQKPGRSAKMGSGLNPYHQIVELLRRVADSKSLYGRDQDLRRASFTRNDVSEIKLDDDVLSFRLKDGRTWSGSPDDLRWAEIFPILEASEVKAVETDLGIGSKSTMGAEMLIELGASERKVGYIQLKLSSPEEDGGDNWILRVTRMDPYGGDPWEGEFSFDQEEEARDWFKSIHHDEDLDHLVRVSRPR